MLAQLVAGSGGLCYFRWDLVVRQVLNFKLPR